MSVIPVETGRESRLVEQHEYRSPRLVRWTELFQQPTRRRTGPFSPTPEGIGGEPNLLHPVSNRLHPLRFGLGERVCVAKFFRGNSMT